MKKVWFVYYNEYVSGPFDTNEIQTRLSAGHWQPDAVLIWWKGQRTWTPVNLWMKNLGAIEKSLEQTGGSTQWYLEKAGKQFGPMKKDQLLDLVNSFPALERIHLWREGLDRWTSLYEVEEVANQLGLQRRTNPRAPIVGKAKIGVGIEPVDGQICELSAGGFAIKNGDQLEPGQTVNVSIESPLLVNPIRSSARVAYVQDTGFAGFRFDNIHQESQSTIIDYVRQFYSKDRVGSKAA